MWGEKSLYGRKFMGIVRSAFVVDEKGKLAGVFYKVSPKDTVPKAEDSARRHGQVRIERAGRAHRDRDRSRRLPDDPGRRVGVRRPRTRSCPDRDGRGTNRY